MKEYKRGEYFTFEANENYYGGKPSIQNVTLRIIESTDTAKVALQKGEVDAAVVLPSDIEDLDDTQISVYPYTENRIGYLGLNTHSDALQDVKVRQAVLFALNKDELNQAAYLDEDYYATPYSFLPPNNPYVTEDVEKYETNAEKAKELLQEAGVTDLSLNLAFNSTDPAQTIQATLIQQQLQQAGITVTLEGGDGTAIFTELKNLIQRNTTCSLAGISWGMTLTYTAVYSKLAAVPTTSKAIAKPLTICLRKQQLNWTQTSVKHCTMICKKPLLTKRSFTQSLTTRKS